MPIIESQYLHKIQKGETVLDKMVLPSGDIAYQQKYSMSLAISNAIETDLVHSMYFETVDNTPYKILFLSGEGEVLNAVSVTIDASGPVIKDFTFPAGTMIVILQGNFKTVKYALDGSTLEHNSNISFYSVSVSDMPNLSTLSGHDGSVSSPYASDSTSVCQQESIDSFDIMGRHNIQTLDNLFYYANPHSVMLNLRGKKINGANNAFFGCTNLFNSTFSSILEGAELYGNLNSMFEGCSRLSSIELKSYAPSGGGVGCNNLFKDCASLSELTLDIDTSVDVLDESLGISQYGMQNMFFGCTSLTHTDWPKTFVVSDTMKSHYSGGFKGSLYGYRMFYNCPVNKPNWTNGTFGSDGSFTLT